jgi:predicted phosphodiesterase
MRYLVLSDIHSNIDALDAVLEAAPPDDFDGVIVLGDLVGYGAEPAAVLDRVRHLNLVGIVRGNHDKAVAGITDAESFNPVAQRAAWWTRRVLSGADREYLEALPEGPTIVDDEIEICHGSPFDEDRYTVDTDDAAAAFAFFQQRIGLYGHTHVAAAMVIMPDDEIVPLFRGNPEREDELVIEPDARYIINPGSVGQPRDGDPRASFAWIDTESKTVVLRRVVYPVKKARERILAAGLPSVLGNRLLAGR